MEIDYRKLLNDELESRQRKNAAYSLRAFSRDLGVPAPKLSQILNGKCGISRDRALAIAAKLKLSQVEQDLFVVSAVAKHSRSPIARTAAGARLKDLLARPFSKISLERFAVIRDWYHLVLLEMTVLERFKPDRAKIARLLDISETNLDKAVERLQSLGLLDVEGDRWTQTEADLETPNDIASRAIREYHRQVLAKAEASLDAHDVSEREFGSLVLSMDAELVPEMKELLRRFRKEAAALTERSQKKNSIYLLNLQFFPVIRKDDL